MLRMNTLAFFYRLKSDYHTWVGFAIENKFLGHVQSLTGF